MHNPAMAMHSQTAPYRGSLYPPLNCTIQAKKKQAALPDDARWGSASAIPFSWGRNMREIKVIGSATCPVSV